MGLFDDRLVVVRGAGDLGTGVAWRLARVGFPVVALDLAHPRAVRRTVAFATALLEGHIEVDGISARRVDDPAEAVATATAGEVAVLAAETLPTLPTPPSVVVDARLAKEVLDTSIEQAPFVVALGPGFVAGTDCHAVVETMRGHRLGSVIWDGTAHPNTGVPGELGGVTARRVLRSTGAGDVRWQVGFGDAVAEGDTIGHVGSVPVVATVSGTVRGLIAPGPVAGGEKIGDIDPRSLDGATDHISDKSLAVAAGVLEAILVWLGGVES
jgi:xanthine dehydrogenase accessory factor